MTRVIFIAGSGRSGSTILDRLLSASPGAFGVGEVGNVWNALRPGGSERRNCGCGQTVQACEFWRAVLERAFGPFDAIPAAHYRSLRGKLAGAFVKMLIARRPDPVMREYSEMLARLYESIATTAGAETVVDSTKQSTYGWLLARARGINLESLHLVRDSRAVSFSWARTVTSSMPISLRRYPYRVSAPLWVRENVAAEVLRFRSARYVRYRYEDLAADPRGVMAQIGLRFSIKPPALSESNSITLPPNHMISGNPVRFVNEEITIREDDEWKSEIKTRDAALVTAITLPLLMRYGYSLRIRPATVSLPEQVL